MGDRFLHRSWGAMTCLLTLFLLSVEVSAARPFATDDATIAEGCELELWWQSEAGEQHAWVSPVCGFGLIELTAAYGVGLSSADDQYELAIKTELKTLEENGLGVTLELAHESAEHQAFKGQTQVVLALSKAWLGEELIWHNNIGRIHSYDEKDDWLVASALQWTPVDQHSLFVELFREQAGRPFYQVGYMFEVLEDVLQLDISYGSRFKRSGAERLVTAGLVLGF